MALWSALNNSGSPVRRPRRGHALIDVEEHALLDVLPEYARESLVRPYDADAIIDQLILGSPELWPTTRVNPLKQEELSDAYYWIIRQTSRSSYNDVRAAIVEGLLEGLEESLRHDLSSARSAQRSFYHKRTQHLFRALADISHRTRSSTIGSALAKFFLAHASHIAAIDASDALGQWCYAIFRARMPEAEQCECLQRVLRERPELPSNLLGRGRKAEEVIQGLDLIASQSIRHDLVPRSCTISESGLPYSVRGGSSDQQSLLASSALSRREKCEHLAQNIIAHEEAAKQGRRMLQLTMGTRYTDRSDLPQYTGLGTLAFGTDTILLQPEEEYII